MAGKRHLTRRRENSQAGGAIRAGRWQHEYGLRQVQLFGNALHRKRVEIASIRKNCEWIAFKRIFGKDIDHAVAINFQRLHSISLTQELAVSRSVSFPHVVYKQSSSQRAHFGPTSAG